MKQKEKTIQNLIHVHFKINIYILRYINDHKKKKHFPK